ncbi:MAG TPA: hypothetical protein VGM77_03250 [Gemmatimonadales bacterium]|jgi:hypothetical protein
MRSLLLPSRALAFSLAGLLAVAACSSDSSDTGGSGSTSCSFQLSGGLSGSPTCTPLGTFYVADGNMTEFGFTPAFGGDPSTLVAISFTGQPSQKTYHETDAGTVAAISVSSGSSAWAMQTADTANGIPATGSFVLTVTSVSTITTASAGNSYQLHGTLTATLPAEAGTSATGTVTLKATF